MANTIVNIDGFLNTPKFEYKRQNLWILSMDGINSYTAKSAGRPKLTMGEAMTVKYVNTYSKYQSGVGNWEPMQFVLNDPIYPSSAKVLYERLTRQWDQQTGRSTYKTQYAMNNFMIKLLAPDFESGSDSVTKDNGVIEIWTLKNAFFTDVDFNQSPLEYDNTDRLTVSFTVNYDCAILSEPMGAVDRFIDHTLPKQ